MGKSKSRTPKDRSNKVSQSHPSRNVNIKALPLWAKPPWPEWSDFAINQETWEETESSVRFNDPSGLVQPKSLTAMVWTRPSEIFSEKVKLVDWKSQFIDLINPNVHLCELSETIRFILSEISELYDYGTSNEFQLEGEGITFTTNSERQGISWKPWDHIYSCCKAGVKGEKPTYNPLGKYYVRLYFMGCWRRITVDDRIPVLSSGQIGLPVTSLEEMWPLILTKALLKIASLHWDDYDHSDEGKIKFSTTAALTGWVCEWIDVPEPISGPALWNDLLDVLPRYKRPASVPNYKGTETAKEEETVDEHESMWWNNKSMENRKSEFNEDSDSDNEKAGKPTDGKNPDESEKLPILKISLAKSKLPVASKSKRLKGKVKEKKKKDAPSRESSKASSVNKEDKKGNKLKGKLKKNILVVDNDDEEEDASVSKNKESPLNIPATKKTKANKKQKEEKEKEQKMSLRSALAKKKVKTDEEKKPANEEDDDEETEFEEQIEMSESVLNSSMNSNSKSVAVNSFGVPFIKKKVPMMNAILEGVHKYSGVDSYSLQKTWESVCGKNIPTAITVVLKIFPKTEGNETTLVPSFLHHPLQLIELRDVPLNNDSNRPTTPLWKKFRWKAWAMKKGLIPMEKEQSGDVRCVEARTPFVLKTNWYEVEVLRDAGHLGEFELEEEDEEFVNQDKQYKRSLGYTLIAPAVLTTDDPCHPPAQPTSFEFTKSHQRSRFSSTKKSYQISLDKIGDKLGKSGASFSLAGSVPRKVGFPDLTENNSKDDGFNSLEFEEEWMGEGEDVDVFKGPSVESTKEFEQEVPPAMASLTAWFECDNLAPNITKFCKFFTSRPILGSCFILQRNPALSSRFIAKDTEEVDRCSGSTTNEHPDEIVNFNAIPDSNNLTLRFSSLRTIDVTSYHINQTHGWDSALYLFSDCWTDQEIVISIDILQDTMINKFTDRAVQDRVASSDYLDSKLPRYMLYVTFMLEPWNWRNDCLETPLIQTTTAVNWMTHLTLPAGRNAFRIWLMEYYYKNDKNGQMMQNCKKRKKNKNTLFNLKFVSQTPMHIGSRDEILRYMTNEPVLLLKQCDRFVQHIWSMFNLFGSSRRVYTRNLRSIRKSYYPSYREHNAMNKQLKGVHECFENYFVDLIIEMNHGKLDHLLALALKCLFLNPKLGQGWKAHRKLEDLRQKASTIRQSNKKMKGINLDTLFQTYKKVGKYEKILTAVNNIQRYCRGWLVRRLFQIRLPGHRRFLQMEYQVRKIAFCLAENSDSVFSKNKLQPATEQPKADKRNSVTLLPKHSDDKVKHILSLLPSTEDNPKPEPEATVTPSPSLIPNPPKWAVDLLKHLMEIYPLLISVHSHAFCTPDHIKILEVEGILPAFLDRSEWLPFFREVVYVPEVSKWCYLRIDLLAYPTSGLILKVINNDTHTTIDSSHNQSFFGRLEANILGYSIVCYRWAVPISSKHRSDCIPFNHYKLQIITPSIQDVLQFKNKEAITARPYSQRLSLQRFTGLYLPGKDESVCRLIVDTEGTNKPHISIRFRPSYDQAKVRLEIRDVSSGEVLLESVNVGGFLLPSIFFGKEDSVPLVEIQPKEPLPQQTEPQPEPALQPKSAPQPGRAPQHESASQPRSAPQPGPASQLATAPQSGPVPSESQPQPGLQNQPGPETQLVLGLQPEAQLESELQAAGSGIIAITVTQPDNTDIPVILPDEVPVTDFPNVAQPSRRIEIAFFVVGSSWPLNKTQLAALLRKTRLLLKRPKRLVFRKVAKTYKLLRKQLKDKAKKELKNDLAAEKPLSETEPDTAGEEGATAIDELNPLGDQPTKSESVKFKSRKKRINKSEASNKTESTRKSNESDIKPDEIALRKSIQEAPTTEDDSLKTELTSAKAKKAGARLKVKGKKGKKDKVDVSESAKSVQLEGNQSEGALEAARRTSSICRTSLKKKNTRKIKHVRPKTYLIKQSTANVTLSNGGYRSRKQYPLIRPHWLLEVVVEEKCRFTLVEEPENNKTPQKSWSIKDPWVKRIIKAYDGFNLAVPEFEEVQDRAVQTDKEGTILN